MENEKIEQPKRLYIGKLPRTATKDQISALFSKFGTVSSIDICDNQNKHFAFVEY